MVGQKSGMYIYIYMETKPHFLGFEIKLKCVCGVAVLFELSQMITFLECEICFNGGRLSCFENFIYV